MSWNFSTAPLLNPDKALPASRYLWIDSRDRQSPDWRLLKYLVGN